MKIFIDFDDVLFNTKDFKKDLINIFIDNGVSEQQFIEESYWDGRYNLKEQIISLEQKYKIDGQKLRKELKYFFEDLSKYVFKDVLPFVQKFKKENLFVISYGDKKIQTEKIRQAGIASYFQEIIITHNKVEAINKILNERKNIVKEKLYFLDDRTQYIMEVKKSLPKIITILITRPEGRYQDEPKDGADVIVSNLDVFQKEYF